MFDPQTRLDAVLGVPWEVLEYERFVAERPEDSGDYLFSEARVRFHAHDADRLRAPSDLRVIEDKGELRLTSERSGGGVAIRAVKRATLERLIAQIDGTRTLAELRAFSGADRPTLERLLAAGLGRVLFVPEAVSELEKRISGVELVRFVGAPYEIVRPYWTNMASVRVFLEGELARIDELHAFVRLLQRAHVLCLLGDDLRSFYRPSSRIAERGAQPGRLYTIPARVLQTPLGSLLLEGPRVGVSLVGGPFYHRALCDAAGDPGALAPSRTLTDPTGLAWGELLTGRAVGDREDRAWFCPPRPLTPAHFAALFSALREALGAAQKGDSASSVQALGQFHHRFVRLHPFRCANQSLAMNLTNLVLARCLGAGIPHLLLDQLALRLEESAYLRVFRLAVEEHGVTGRTEARWAALGEKKSRAYRLIQGLQASKSDAEAAELVRAHPEAARSALIVA